MAEALRKPDWIPYYIQRMKGSKAYKELSDTQFGWYSKLLVELADSDVPGYLVSDIRILWAMAGAKTEKFFRERGGLELLDRHFKRTDDGLHVYNERMLEVLHEQMVKITKRRKRSVISLSLSLQEVPNWIPQDTFDDYVKMRDQIKKPLTGNAIVLAYRKLEKLKEQGHDPKGVLEQSIFRSWAGLFPIEVENGRGSQIHNGSGQNPGVQKPESINGSRLAETDCPKCGGSGWDSASGKAARCECWVKNRKVHAASAGKT